MYRPLEAPLASAPPAHLLCPITQVLLEDPVVAADGHVYSRSAIALWVSNAHEQGGELRSPMTNLPLSNAELRPVHALRAAVEEWKQRASVEANVSWLPGRVREWTLLQSAASVVPGVSSLGLDTRGCWSLSSLSFASLGSVAGSCPHAVAAAVRSPPTHRR